MQSSEKKARIPRNVSNSLAQEACNRYNKRTQHPRANPTTGIVNDKTGMFITVEKKKRELILPERQGVNA